MELDEVGWASAAVGVMQTFKAWRLAHPTATLSEIETALDGAWAVARAQVLTEAAQASAAADLTGVPAAACPRCPACGGTMALRGRARRTLVTTHEQPLVLQRHRLVCPACGTGLFPPG